METEPNQSTSDPRDYADCFDMTKDHVDRQRAIDRLVERGVTSVVGAYLGGSDLSRVDLSRITLVDCELNGTYCDNALLGNFHACVFSDCRFHQTRFRNLSDVRVERCVVSSCTLWNRPTGDSCVRDSVITDCRFVINGDALDRPFEAEAGRVSISGCRLRSVHAMCSDLSSMLIENCDVSHSRFLQSRFNQSVLADCRCRSNNFMHAIGAGSSIEGSVFDSCVYTDRIEGGLKLPGIEPHNIDRLVNISDQSRLSDEIRRSTPVPVSSFLLWADSPTMPYAEKVLVSCNEEMTVWVFRSSGHEPIRLATTDQSRLHNVGQLALILSGLLGFTLSRPCITNYVSSYDDDGEPFPEEDLVLPNQIVDRWRELAQRELEWPDSSVRSNHSC